MKLSEFLSSETTPQRITWISTPTTYQVRLGFRLPRQGSGNLLVSLFFWSLYCKEDCMKAKLRRTRKETRRLKSTRAARSCNLEATEPPPPPPPFQLSVNHHPRTAIPRSTATSTASPTHDMTSPRLPVRRPSSISSRLSFAVSTHSAEAGRPSEDVGSTREHIQEIEEIRRYEVDFSYVLLSGQSSC